MIAGTWDIPAFPLRHARRMSKTEMRSTIEKEMLNVIPHKGNPFYQNAEYVKTFGIVIFARNQSMQLVKKGFVNLDAGRIPTIPTGHDTIDAEKRYKHAWLLMSCSPRECGSITASFSKTSTKKRFFCAARALRLRSFAWFFFDPWMTDMVSQAQTFDTV
ncbi:hypothetical protein TNCV_2377471 [Trichonephila clavipes]|nr:hypothetical protein TNCV_2377471 [Trichonephila clavipes]